MCIRHLCTCTKVISRQCASTCFVHSGIWILRRSWRIARNVVARAAEKKRRETSKNNGALTKLVRETLVHSLSFSTSVFRTCHCTGASMIFAIHNPFNILKALRGYILYSLLNIIRNISLTINKLKIYLDKNFSRSSWKNYDVIYLIFCNNCISHNPRLLTSARKYLGGNASDFSRHFAILIFPQLLYVMLITHTRMCICMRTRVRGEQESRESGTRK